MVDALKRASAKRITVVVAVLPVRPAGQEGPRPRADLGPPRRRPLQGRRRRPHHVGRPARRADPGLLRRPGRPPLRHAGAARALPREARPRDPHRGLARHGPRARRRHLERQARRARSRSSTSAATRSCRTRSRCTRSSATVDGRVCLLVDDLIDTGRTIVKAAEALKANGAIGVVVAATHAVFSSPAVEHPAERRHRQRRRHRHPAGPRVEALGPPHGPADRAAARARHPRGLRGRLGHEHVRRRGLGPAMAITTPRPWLASYAEGVPRRHRARRRARSSTSCAARSSSTATTSRSSSSSRTTTYAELGDADRARRRGPAPARRADGRPGRARAAELPAAHRRVLRRPAPRRDRRRAQPALHAARAAPPVRGPRREAS